MLGLLLDIFITTALFNTFKIITGKLRPNFFAVCNYAGYADAFNSGNFVSYFNATSPDNFGSISRCLGAYADVEDSRKSFLSGHAAVSFCGMFYTSLLITSGFLPGTWYYPFRFLACIAPLYLSSWIAITRIQDKEHFTEDVVAGALLGIFVAYSVWHMVKSELDKLKNTAVVIATEISPLHTSVSKQPNAT